ncbi:MAG: Coenzyme F420 hydrogenase/dehydrogenase, beta subunit C-terminal domain [Nitriliruptor sp.]
MSADPFEVLLGSVVDGGYCIGCGLCAAVPDAPLRIRMTEEGVYRPELVADPSVVTRGAASTAVLSVCPFTAEGPHEDQLAAERFAPAPHRSDLGYHLATYAGYVAEGDYRREGSSGGLAKWLLAELLRTDLVDRVIQVAPADPQDEDPRLFTYTIADDLETLRRGSRAAYYPVELSSVIATVRAEPARYAITGVPCFIKGLRRLAATDPVIADRVRFTVGIICGHLKTTGYAESLGWQLGVPPDRLGGIDFRTKIPGRTAREKGVTAVDRQGEPSQPRVVQELVGTKYPYGFFRASACDFCDDVLAETADVAVGDAWLPEYVGSGNSVVVTRHPRIQELVTGGIAAGRLHLETITPDAAAATQAGGLRDRREGLAYRLALTERQGRWHPPKRVAPSTDLPLVARLLYRLRRILARRSAAVFRDARARGDLARFVRRMRPWTELYELVVRVGKLRGRLAGALAGVRARVRS